MTTKQALLTKKWKTFHDHIVKYNRAYPSDNPLINYTLEQAKNLTLEDTFWNFGHLTHPNEPWAVEMDTQRGIQAYLLLCRCEEELRRISREVRQLLKWCLVTAAKIDEVLTLSKLSKLPFFFFLSMHDLTYNSLILLLVILRLGPNINISSNTIGWRPLSDSQQGYMGWMYGGGEVVVYWSHPWSRATFLQMGQWFGALTTWNPSILGLYNCGGLGFGVSVEGDDEKVSWLGWRNGPLVYLSLYSCLWDERGRLGVFFFTIDFQMRLTSLCAVYVHWDDGDESRWELESQSDDYRWGFPRNWGGLHYQTSLRWAHCILIQSKERQMDLLV